MYVISIARSLIGSCRALVADPAAIALFDDGSSRSPVPALSKRTVAFALAVVCVCVLVGVFAGAGIGSGTASDGAVASQTDVAGEWSEFGDTTSPVPAQVAATPNRYGPPEDERLVVRFEDDHVVSGAIADDLPPEPEITTESGDYLVVDEHEDYDLKVVQTMDGEVATVGGEPINRVDDDPDLVVFDDDVISDELEVDRDTGAVRTVDGGETVTVGDGEDAEDVVYLEYDTIELTPEIVDVNGADEGETLSVTTEISNTRWAHASGETVELRLLDSDYVIESVTGSVDVDGGDQTAITLEYETESGDYVTDTVEVAVDGNTDSQDIEIGAAGAAVSITETNTPIEDSELFVTAEIHRYGDIPEGTQSYPISLFIDGTEEQTQVLSLAPGETTTRTFTYETDSDDLPEVDTMVTSRTDSSSTTVPVISIEEHEENIGATITNTSIGNLTEEFTVDASFEYDGEIPYGETGFLANLTVDGTVTDQRNVTLDGSSPINETFVHDRHATDPPISNATIETPGGTESVTFERDTAIEFTDVTEPAARNESLSATVRVENTGETPGQETLTIAASNPSAVSSNATHTFPVQLEPSESITENVTFDLTDNAPPRLELRANTSNTVATRTIEVRDNEPRFEIETRTVEGATDPDANLTVTATVRNTGGVAGTQDVDLAFDGEPVATEQLTLEPDEDATLSAVVERPDDGTYSYGATTDDDSVSDTTTVGDSETASSAEASDSDSDRAWNNLPIGFGSLVLPLLVASVLGLLLVGAVVIKNRPAEVPDEIQDRVAALQPAARKLQTAARNLVSNGGSGTVVVQNALPRKALVRIRIRSGDEIVFLEDFELAEDERRTLECLPDAAQFEVGSGVDDIAAHEQTFQRGTDEVGVILRPEGITIKAL